MPLSPTVTLDGQVNLRLQSNSMVNTAFILNGAGPLETYSSGFVYRTHTKGNSVAPGADAFVKVRVDEQSPLSIAVGGGAYYQKVYVDMNTNQNYSLNFPVPGFVTAVRPDTVADNKWMTVWEVIGRVFYDVTPNASIFAGASYGKSLRSETFDFHTTTLDITTFNPVYARAKVGLEYATAELGVRWTFGQEPAVATK